MTRSFVPEYIYRETQYGKASPWSVKQEHVDEALNNLYSTDHVLKKDLEEIHKNPPTLINILRYEGKFVIGTGTFITRKPKPPKGMRYEGRQYSATYAKKSGRLVQDIGEHTGSDEDDYVYIGETYYYVSAPEKLKTEFRREQQKADYEKVLELNLIKRLANASIKNSIKHGKPIDPEDVYNAALKIPTTYAGTSEFTPPLDYHGNPFNFSQDQEEDRETEYQE